MLKQEFEISPVLATELKSLFTTVNYFTPILGAYVADRYLGRFVSLMYSYEFPHEYTSTHCMTTFAFTNAICLPPNVQHSTHSCASYRFLHFVV